MAGGVSKHGLGIPVISPRGVSYEPDGVLNSTKPQGVLGHAEGHIFSGLLQPAELALLTGL